MSDTENLDIQPPATEPTAGEEQLTDDQIFQQILDGDLDGTGQPPTDPTSDPDEEDNGDLEPPDDPPQDPEDSGSDPDPDADAATPDTPAHTGPDLEEQIERLTQRVSTEEGRARAANSRAADLQSQLDAAIKRRDGLKPDADARAERKAKIDEVTEEHGEILAPFKSAIEEIDERSDALLQSEEQNVEDLQAKLQKTMADEEAVMLKEHPDAYDLLKEHGAAFNAWIEDQPKELRDIHKANYNGVRNGEGAALIISKFKFALQNAVSEDEPGAEDPPPTNQSRDEIREAQRRGSKSGGSSTTNRPPPTRQGGNTEEEDFDWAVQQIEKKRQPV